MAPKANFEIERNPKSKGSYRRRLDDAFVALDCLKVDSFRPEAAFIFYYLACEKVAKVMIGISRRKPALSYFKKINVRVSDLTIASKFLSCGISKGDIEAIFSDIPTSACHLRNKLIHDIGPTHVFLIQKSAPNHVNRMRKFLRCRKAIIRHMDLHRQS